MGTFVLVRIDVTRRLNLMGDFASDIFTDMSHSMDTFALYTPRGCP
jgi:hypothetical protein